MTGTGPIAPNVVLGVRCVSGLMPEDGREHQEGA